MSSKEWRPDVRVYDGAFVSLASEWPVYSNYTIIDGNIRRQGHVTHFYRPIEHPEVVVKLADLKEGDEKAVLDFVHNWGTLGYVLIAIRDQLLSDEDRVKLWGKSGTFDDLFDMEPLYWIWAHARGVRVCLEFLEGLKIENGKEEKLHSLVNNLYNLSQALWQRHSDKGENTYTINSWRTIPFGDKNRLRDILVMMTLDLEKPRAIAYNIITDIVNSNLEVVNQQLDYNEDNGTIVMGHYSPCLLGFIYWHLAQMVIGELGWGRCEECGAYFVRTDQRQRFCPPSGYESESRCGTRARLKRLKRRQKENDNLRKPTEGKED